MQHSPETREKILAELQQGRSLVSICDDKGMPNASTVYSWIKDEPDFGQRVTRAREIGYIRRADRAVQEAKQAPDAALGRLALDAERWYLGKLSIALSDKVKVVGGDEGDNPIQHQHDLTEEAADAFTLAINGLVKRV